MAVSGMALTLCLLERPAETAEAFERAAALYGALGETEQEAAARSAAAHLRATPETATPPEEPPRRWWDRLRG